MQFRYYDPKIGRFINADALVSTGAGIVGYNMFAYCNNNPANSSDPTGMCPLCLVGKNSDQFMTSVSCGFGGGSSRGGYYSSGGGYSGYSGGGNSQYEDIFEELDAIIEKVLGVVGSFAEACWDAYMRSYNMQQEAQLQQAIAVNNLIANRFSTPEKAINSLDVISAAASSLGFLAAAATVKPITIVLGPVKIVTGVGSLICYSVAGIAEAAEMIIKIVNEE